MKIEFIITIYKYIYININNIFNFNYYFSLLCQFKDY